VYPHCNSDSKTVAFIWRHFLYATFHAAPPTSSRGAFMVVSIISKVTAVVSTGSADSLRPPTMLPHTRVQAQGTQEQPQRVVGGGGGGGMRIVQLSIRIPGPLFFGTLGVSAVAAPFLPHGIGEMNHLAFIIAAHRGTQDGLN
jgi:hypothetical protein